MSQPDVCSTSQLVQPANSASLRKQTHTSSSGMNDCWRGKSGLCRCQSDTESVTMPCEDSWVRSQWMSGAVCLTPSTTRAPPQAEERNGWQDVAQHAWWRRPCGPDLKETRVCQAPDSQIQKPHERLPNKFETHEMPRVGRNARLLPFPCVT